MDKHISIAVTVFSVVVPCAVGIISFVQKSIDTKKKVAQIKDYLNIDYVKKNIDISRNMHNHNSTVRSSQLSFFQFINK